MSGKLKIEDARDNWQVFILKKSHSTVEKYNIDCIFEKKHKNIFIKVIQHTCVINSQVCVFGKKFVFEIASMENKFFSSAMSKKKEVPTSFSY